MALLLLVRHGQTDDNLAGRISGQAAVPLNARGQEQARAVAQVLAGLGVHRIFSSPVWRARQTAEILAAQLGVALEEVVDLREVDYGDWEGKLFRDLRQHPITLQVFQDPASVAFPNGERLLAVQQRAVRVIEWVRRQYPQQVTVLVSHGDVLRTALAHYLGMPFNEYRRLTLDTGAISVLELFDDWVRVKAVNFVPQVGRQWLQSLYPVWQALRQRAAPPAAADA
ncbi:MAG: phosphoglycerate mutase [Candidatus Tectimicrobiota bacterium]|nr:MAG: phosphoglycerate mutase [Candidatus Tectomicrobia bacterium]